MSYRGKTYQIPCDVGGVTNNKNIDLIPPQGMLMDSVNINLLKGGRKKRGGTSPVNSSNSLDSGARMYGLHQFRLENGTNNIVIATNSPAIHYYTSDPNSTTNITPGGGSWVGTNTVVEMVNYKDEVYICNGKDIVQTWDGAAGTTSDITTPAADWTGTNQPKLIVKHGRGAAGAERLWGIGVPTQPNRIYYCASGDGKDWTGASAGNIDINTQDGFGILSLIEYGERLMAFGKSQAYIIDDTNTTHSNWNYVKTQWDGGVGAQRLVCRTPYDLIAMMEDGTVYSVLTAEQYGDYKAGSLFRGTFIEYWIQENIDLSNIDDFHMKYDPTLRAVKIFMRHNNADHVNLALVYFIDRPAEEAWIPHENQYFDSGYKASTSAVVRESTGKWKIYTGGWDDGFVWELETSNLNDNSSAYPAGFKTPRLTMGNPRNTKRFDNGWLITKPEGSYNIDIDWWLDGVQQTQRNVDLSPDGGFTLGTSFLGIGTLGGDELIDNSFLLGNAGKRIQFHITNNRADEDFFISQILIDHKNLGARPTK